jgi:stage III sporulation protein AB
MLIIKMVLLFFIFLSCFYIGITISNKYKKRVEELKEMKKGFSILETKMKYTYDVLPEIMKDVSVGLSKNIASIFKNTATNMAKYCAKDAWCYAIENCHTNMNNEDIQILKGFGKLLGKTDVNGQVSQIELTNKFLETQIEKAEQELKVNAKLYKTLGAVCGLALVILLV